MLITPVVDIESEPILAEQWPSALMHVSDHCLLFQTSGRADQTGRQRWQVANEILLTRAGHCIPLGESIID
jgi:hypothetical protein